MNSVVNKVVITIVVVGRVENHFQTGLITNWLSEEFEILGANDTDTAVRLATEKQPTAVIIVGEVEPDATGDLLVKRLNSLPNPLRTLFVDLNTNAKSNLRSDKELFELDREGYVCDAAVSFDSGKQVVTNLIRRVVSS